MLPPEFRFDVAKAARALAALAEAEPSAPILLTLAQVDGDGLGAESEVRLPASGAAALLASVGEDQRFRAGDRTLFVLRVSHAGDLPPGPKESWDYSQDNSKT